MSKQTDSSRHWGHSLRKLSWDESKDKTASQKLISSTVHEWYDAKHRISSDEEIELINSLNISHCPYCLSVNIKRNGYYRNNTVRYYCNSCKASFNPLTGTIFDDKNIRYPNGSNILFIYSSFIRLLHQPETTEMPILQANTGLSRYLKY